MVTDFTPRVRSGDVPALPVPTQELTDSGAITLLAGVVNLNKAGVIAATLAAPPSYIRGARLVIMSETAQAHTVTQTTPGFDNGGTASDVATFGGAIGDAFEIVAWDGVWKILWLQGVTAG